MAHSRIYARLILAAEAMVSLHIGRGIPKSRATDYCHHHRQDCVQLRLQLHKFYDVNLVLHLAEQRVKFVVIIGLELLVVTEMIITI